MKKILLFIFLFACLCGRSQVVSISDTNSLRNYINTVIVNNNIRGITAQNFNNVLNGFLNTLFPNDSISLATGAANDTLFYWKNRVKKFYVLLRVGGGPGALAYAGLTDVSLTTLSDGQLTKWNAITSKWNNFTVDKTYVGLPLVENTALSTWPGSSNLRTVGTITTGIWNASPIGDAYISSAGNWNAKQNAVTLGTPSQYFKGDLTLGAFSPSTVGLGNVQNVDQTNAANLASGSIPAGRYGNATIPISALNASGGTSSDFLKKDGTWATPSAGATAFSALTDVALSSILNGQLSKWNSSASKWNNFTPGAGDVTGWLGYTPMNPTGTTLQYWRGNGTLATFPTDLSSFGNGPGYLSGTVGPTTGGSGLSTYTPYNLLATGTTSTGNYQQISPGTAGQILTSNGPGVLPTMQNPGTVSSYASLTDVAITSIAAGQLTKWNGGTSKWNNFTPGAGDVTGWLGYTPMNPTGTASQYWKGNGTLGTFPANVSFFINDNGYMKSADTASLWVGWARLYNSFDSAKAVNDAKYRTQTDTSYAHFLQTRARGQQIADSLGGYISRNYLPTIWNANPIITGNSNTLHIITGSIMADMPTLHERISLAGNNITLWDSTYGQGGSILVLPNQPGFYLQNSSTAGHGLNISKDSLTAFGDNASTASYLFAGGGAKFQGHVIGITESSSDSSNNLISTAGVKRLLANYTPGLGAARIGPLDSLTRTAATLQIVNNTILAQTANGSFAGMEPSAHWAEVDSIIRRLLVSNVKLVHPGAGLWTGWSSLIGDSLYLPNLQTTGDLSIVAMPDSSRRIGVNFSTVAGVTAAQTLTNKTLQSPLITGVQLGVTSTLNYVWTATDAFGHGSWQASAGGGGGSQNISHSQTATSDTLKISGGTGFILPGATSSLAGLITAASQRRLDSTIYVGWTGKGKRLLRSPYTKDSLLISGIGMTANAGLAADYTGTADSASWNLRISALTTNGDLLYYNNGVTRLPGAATNGMVLTWSSGLPVWQAVAGTGTVTNVSAPSGLSTLFTTNVSNQTSTPQLTFSPINAPAHSFLGNFTGASGAYSFSNPALASADFANQGNTVRVLHGNAAGNPSWAAVELSTDVTGTLLGSSFPALSGDVGVTAGTLTTAIGANKVTNAMLAGSIDLATKVSGIGSPANGFTGVNNGSKTITLGGNFATSGSFPLSFTLGGSTSLTLPSSGTVLTTTGSGSGLSGLVTSITGTANEIIASATTGGITLSTPQPIGTGNAPIFTGITLTGLPVGANTDNLVTILGGSLRTVPFSAFNLQSGQYTPTDVLHGSLTSITYDTSLYIRAGNTVTLSGGATISVPSAGQYSIHFSLPFPSNLVNHDGFGTLGSLGSITGVLGTSNIDHTGFINLISTAAGNYFITWTYTYLIH